MDDVIGENEEEARRPRIARRPQTPTKAEYDAHMTLHADYRDWCPDCVAGRGISHQHRSSKKERTEREFSVDYAFMTAEDVGEDMCNVSKVRQRFPWNMGTSSRCQRSNKVISSMSEWEN